MPIRIYRLSRAEQAEYRAAAQQLQAQGLIPTIPERLECSRALDILAGGPASEVFEFPSGTVVYVVWVQLVARQSGLILLDCEIATDWDDQIVLASDEASSLRSLGCPGPAPDGVLNERIARSLRFHRCGDLVRGTILAWGLRPIPDAYRTGAIVPFQLTFTDSLGNQFGLEERLSVYRTAKRQNTALQQRSSLRDPQETSESSEVVVREDARVPGARINASQTWTSGEEFE